MKISTGNINTPHMEIDRKKIQQKILPKHWIKLQLGDKTL